jgi:hypothetical protein
MENCVNFCIFWRGFMLYVTTMIFFVNGMYVLGMTFGLLFGIFLSVCATVYLFTDKILKDTVEKTDDDDTDSED